MDKQKKDNVLILGSTGSIGTQTLEVLSVRKEKNIYALTVNKNIDLLLKQIIIFKPKYVAVYDSDKGLELKNILSDKKIKTEVLIGKKGILQLVKDKNVDFVVNAMALSFDDKGHSNTKDNIDITIEVIKQHKKLALANKETIVCAGKKIMAIAKKYGVEIRPIDSEHSAIFQCLQGEDKKNIKKLIITCSGGPFFGKKMSELKNVRVEDCMKHPTWNMGKKICIDSATLVNKGLEVIEAHFLFGVPVEKIEVVIHRESIIHSMVEFNDGSVKAEMSVPSMKIPIEYALFGNNRKYVNVQSIDFYKLKSLHFDKIDNKNFKAVDIAFSVLKKGGKYPEKFCKADEEAVKKFINGEIRFDQIVQYIEKEVKK